MILRLGAATYGAIIAAARTASPAEACGLLVGRREPDGLTVTRVVAAANVLADVPGRFELDPRVRLATEKECRRSNGEEWVLGHWHSHPDGPASPSATDLEMAFEPRLVWLIVGLDGNNNAQAGAFIPDPEQRWFRSVCLRVGDDADEKRSCAGAHIPT